MIEQKADNVSTSRRNPILKRILQEMIEIQQNANVKSSENDILTKVIGILEREPFTAWKDIETIVVLGAEMELDSDGIWKLPTIVHKGTEKELLVGGKSRAKCSKIIYDEGFRGQFLVTGGSQTDENGLYRESRARVLAHQIEKSTPELQVTIIGKEGSGNTIGNARNTAEFYQNTHQLPPPQIGILTNAWHMPRALLHFIADPFFTNTDTNFIPIIVEDVFSRTYPFTQWPRWVEAHPATQSRINAERNGIRDFVNDTYSPHQW